MRVVDCKHVTKSRMFREGVGNKVPDIYSVVSRRPHRPRSLIKVNPFGVLRSAPRALSPTSRDLRRGRFRNISLVFGASGTRVKVVNEVDGRPHEKSR